MDEFLKRVIVGAGERIAEPLFDKGVTHSVKTNLTDLLTEADVAVSYFFIEQFQKEFPDHAITSEEREETINKGADYEWVIDPIDGTRNFAMGVPLWCTIIALEYRGETVLGAVYNPKANELFFAKKGHGATLNDMPINVGKRTEILHTAGSFGRYYDESNTEYGSQILRFKKFGAYITQHEYTWLHMFGTMLAGCHMAAGGFDYFIQNAGLDHDYLAPILIMREAGAKVTDSDWNEWKRGVQDVVAAKPV